MVRKHHAASTASVRSGAPARGLALIGVLTAAVLIAALVATALLGAVASVGAPGGTELAPFRWDSRSGPSAG
ncbi:MAG TPA: hypothetical protein VM305_11755 [Candidatus Limnocylindrales bacterium]|nr:hypothetical protein [Candidatus Limnocylindrales bacterium]